MARREFRGPVLIPTPVDDTSPAPRLYVDNGLSGKASLVHTHAGGTGSADSPALDLLQASLATRDSGPRVLVYAGSSTVEGNNATVATRRFVNLLTAAIQAAYPLRTGAASPAMRLLADAVGAVLTAGVQGVNAGVGGTTSSTYLTSTTMTQIGDLNPSMVLHMVGSNDYAGNVNPTTFKSNLLAKINTLKTEITVPHIHVLVQPYQRTDVVSPTYAWSAYGTAMAELAAADPTNVAYYDISAPYVAAEMSLTDPYNLLDTDGIHQTDAGHTLMADLLRECLKVSLVTGGSAAPVDSTAPSVPTGLTATPGNGQVSLSWVASSDNVGVTGYNVYRDGGLITSTPGTSYADNGRTNGTLYSYRISAVDAAGNASAQTAAVTATPVSSSDTTPPTVPTGLTATPGNAQVSLSWTASTDAVGVTGYRVRRGGTLVGSPTTTSYVDTSAINDTAYTYTVAAFDAALNESAQTAGVSATPTVGGAALVSDDFTRGDSATSLGTTPVGSKAWTVAATGPFGIDNFQAYNTNATNGTALVDVGIFNYEVSLKITWTTGGNSPGLVVRGLNDTNRITLVLDAARIGFWMSPAAGGTSAAIDGASVRPGAAQTVITRTTGQQYTLRVVANGDTLSGYLDGALIHTIVLSAPELTRFTGVGYTNVGLRGNNLSRFDDLAVVAL